ncbi:MAG: NUDIX domain-containing protein [Oscillospiraceae bacterium]|nr:NUDIX domain-containing protein [Oscillospiraceae bacterium]
MTILNVIAVLDRTGEKCLFCKRRKDPYKGLYNFVGGHAEDGEDGLSAAYRELYEETGITDKDIRLIHLMDFTYCLYNEVVEVYFGYLDRDIAVHGDENELLWLDREQDFFSTERFAGEGNIGHIMEHIRLYERNNG